MVSKITSIRLILNIICNKQFLVKNLKNTWKPAVTICGADGVIIDPLVVEVLRISTEFMESNLVAWPKVVGYSAWKISFFFSTQPWH